MATVPVAGCDPHVDTVAIAAVSALDHQVMADTVPNSPVGHERLAGLLATHGVIKVGIEGASGLERALAEYLHAAGFEIVEIPTRLTAGWRSIDEPVKLFV